MNSRKETIIKDMEESKPGKQKDAGTKPDDISPPHYKSFSIEVIDMMEAIWGPYKTAVHCEMNAFKYRMRAGNKLYPDCSADESRIKDLKKAQWYENKRDQLKTNLKIQDDENSK